MLRASPVLARVLSVIQQGMLRNNPGHVKESVNEATVVLIGMLNTHKCLLDSGVEIQKKLEAGAEVLSIRRTRKEEILLVLKNEGDVSAFQKALDQAVGEKAEVKYLVSKRSLEVRDLDETVTREEVVAALCIALGKPDLGDHFRLYKRFGGVQTAVGAQLTPDTMVSLMLQSEQIWMLIESFVTLVMKTRELDGHVERGNSKGR